MIGVNWIYCSIDVVRDSTLSCIIGAPLTSAAGLLEVTMVIAIYIIIALAYLALALTHLLH